MFLMLRIGPAVVGLDVVDSTEVATLVNPVKQPGTAFNVVAGLRVDPGHVQLVARAQVEGLDPGQQIDAPQFSPASQVGIADAAVVGVGQIQAAMAAAAAMFIFFLLPRLDAAIKKYGA